MGWVKNVSAGHLGFSARSNKTPKSPHLALFNADEEREEEGRRRTTNFKDDEANYISIDRRRGRPTTTRYTNLYLDLVKENTKDHQIRAPFEDMEIDRQEENVMPPPTNHQPRFSQNTRLNDDDEDEDEDDDNINYDDADD
ncbi:uncharacterized protein LOC131313999 [Rhododendron vialii]|uniref:uncharacterized protein LOC131313999 n=1 Tax=Rhododendron vialii TaxID=182163 RepID=UPI00265E2DFD|nr:uncharacterized protein LOC131313999 [Rhododendron vialii]